MKRLLAIALICLALAPSSAFAASSDGQAIVQDVDLSNYPRVGLQVIVPGSLVKQGETPQFGVRENGREAELVKAKADITDQPINAVLVIDCSGSMEGAPMAAAKSAALAFLGELKPPSTAALVTFSNRPHVVVPSTTDVTMLSAAVDSIDPSGETALYDAVVTAVGQAKGSGGSQPVVIVLSDGGDTMSRTPLTRAMSEIRKSKVPVLAVALASEEADPKALKLLAQQNGGRVASIKNLEDLTEYYRGLAKELQTRYAIAYSSNRPSTMDLVINVDAKTSAGAAAAEIVVDNPVAASDQPLGSTVEPVAPASVFTYGFAIFMVFASVGLFVSAGALLFVKPRTGLDQLGFYDQVSAEGSDAASVMGSDRVIAGMMGAVDYVAGRGGFKRLAYEQLDRAGLPMRPTEYITLHVALVVLAGLLASLLGSLVASLLVVVVATAAPIMWIGSRISKRKKQFEEQLPDTLDLLAGSLRAGWGLQQATDVIVEQCKPPMADEFRRSQTEIRLGKTVEQALQSIADRMQSNDFAWVVSAIAIQREVGGNLAELLSIVAGTIRERNALKRQIGALTSEGRLSAWILFALPFFEALVLYLMNPTYMSQLFTTVPGIAMLLIGAALLCVGGFWLSRAIRVEV